MKSFAINTRNSVLTFPPKNISNDKLDLMT